MTFTNEKLTAAFDAHANKVVKVKDLQEDLAHHGIELGDILAGIKSVKGLYLSEKGGVYVQIGAYRDALAHITGAENDTTAAAIAQAIEHAHDFNDDVKAKRINAIRV